jgi:glycosyltransferase involved in cell wall biosynthesis
MKLLFADFTLPYVLRNTNHPAGGWAAQLLQWAIGLSATGHRVGVLTFKGANALVGSQSVCDLIETYDPDRGVRVLKYFTSYIPALYEGARAFAPDAIIQSTRSIHTAIMASIADRLQIPFVHRIASDIDADDRYKNEMLFYERVAYRYGRGRASLIICQNDYQFAQMRRAYPDKRLLLLENVLDVPARTPAPRARRDRRYVAWLGVFRKPKNLSLLAHVAESAPEMEFHVAGRPSQDMDAETALALKRLETQSNVRLAGYVAPNGVFEFLSGATALLCTSHYEGFSNTFLEAFAAGTPVVTRAGVDPNAIIARNRLGYVARNDTDLVEGLRSICGTIQDEYDSLAYRCRQYVETHHAPEGAAHKLVIALSELRKNGRDVGIARQIVK